MECVSACFCSRNSSAYASINATTAINHSYDLPPLNEAYYVNSSFNYHCDLPPLNVVYYISSGLNCHPESPSLAKNGLEIRRSSLSLMREIGSGQFSTVFQAKFNCNKAFNDENLAVAVKFLKEELTESFYNNFRREAEILIQLSNPNVIKLIGICFDDNPKGIIFEYANYGDLEHFLK